jgi:squalene-associated FAD-dependent desaturase
MPRVHVIGAGLSGLAAALRLSAAGNDVTIYEAAGHAGGRCRSFRDEHLGVEIDNGNHLLLSGNSAAMAFLDEVGSRHTLLQGDAAAFPFVDFADNSRWVVRPNAGPLPWWLLFPGRRVPGTRVSDYLSALRLRQAGPDTTVTMCLDSKTQAYRRFWEPLVVAVLNTHPDEAAARLLWPVLVETFGRGEAACRPCIARTGLSATFIEPAVTTLLHRGAEIRFNTRLRSIASDGDRVGELQFAKSAVTVGGSDVVVLAVAASVAASLVPGLTTPCASRPIVNAHYRAEDRVTPPAAVPFLGIIDGTAEWLFVRNRIISVTVSAATEIVDMDADRLAALLWSDVVRALGLQAEELPPYRIVKERRATFAQTPDEVARRPGPKTSFANLYLAGDWTDTGLPATIEGAIRSGNRAATSIRQTQVGTS